MALMFLGYKVAREKRLRTVTYLCAFSQSKMNVKCETFIQPWLPWDPSEEFILCSQSFYVMVSIMVWPRDYNNHWRAPWRAAEHDCYRNSSLTLQACSKGLLVSSPCNQHSENIKSFCPSLTTKQLRAEQHSRFPILSLIAVALCLTAVVWGTVFQSRS